MKIDDRQLDELIVESQDLQVDALRQVKEIRAAMADLRGSGRGEPVGVERARAFDVGRRRMLRTSGLSIGALGARGLVGGAFGATLMAVVAGPAHAQEDPTVQILQTAASLENLAVSTYEAVLELDFFGQNDTVVAFAMTTRDQHAEHALAFNALTETLGGEPQNEVNPVYDQVVQGALPSLTGYGAVVDLASQLEAVATQTYVSNVMALEDAGAKELMASIMGVEAQHLAILRAVGALVGADAGELVTIDPAVDMSALPASFGSVAFTGPFLEPQPANVAAPDSGDVE